MEHYYTHFAATDDPPGYEAECVCGEWSAWRRRSDQVGRLFAEHVASAGSVAA